MKKLNIISVVFLLFIFYSCGEYDLERTNTHDPNGPFYKPSVSTLTTTAASSITSNSATSGGNITSDGGSTITARGVCWSIVTNPTITDTKTNDGSGKGVFTSSLTGLNASTTYYVRAYATSNAGTAYGSQINFTTSATTAGIPTLTTTAISLITTSSATSGGDVSNAGTSSVTARGVCWSTSVNPTITSPGKTSDGTGIGTFTSTITGLASSTTYHVRAYATNSAGTAYGTDLSFITSNVAVSPTVSTTAITSITSSTALGGGTISSDGGATVTSRGICWSSSATPTIALLTKTSDGTGTGTFISPITGLTSNTTYYVRAYASNTIGTSYGTQVSFITQGLPVLSTTNASLVTQTTATSGGNITSDGAAAVTERGVCWGTSINPTTALATHSSDGVGTGTFTSSITGLSPNTTYYVRAYATNSVGTNYGSQVNFNTLASTSLSVGQSYQGGIVAYILVSGDPGFDAVVQHGLIAAPTDQNTSTSLSWWFNGSYISTGATATALGTGSANTTTIYAVQGAGTYAAKICFDLVLSSYADWYLPSKDELNKLYLNRASIGGFTSSYYWSSSEVSSGNAWVQNFSDGSMSSITKVSTNYVRAVRSF